jgi:hypothetical protein
MFLEEVLIGVGIAQHFNYVFNKMAHAAPGSLPDLGITGLAFQNTGHAFNHITAGATPAAEYRLSDHFSHGIGQADRDSVNNNSTQLG